MRRIVLFVAACALSLGLAGTASAAHDHGRHGPPRGVRFSGGYYYTSRHHPNWERRAWDSHYRRYHYYDSYRHCWYYWVPARACYYPVGYVCD